MLHRKETCCEEQEKRKEGGKAGEVDSSSFRCALETKWQAKEKGEERERQ